MDMASTSARWGGTLTWPGLSGRLWGCPRRRLLKGEREHSCFGKRGDLGWGPVALWNSEGWSGMCGKMDSIRDFSTVGLVGHTSHVVDVLEQTTVSGSQSWVETGSWRAKVGCSLCLHPYLLLSLLECNLSRSPWGICLVVKVACTKKG